MLTTWYLTLVSCEYLGNSRTGLYLSSRRSVNATSRDYHGFTEAISFNGLLRSTSIRRPLPEVSPKRLPPRYMVVTLIQHFIDIFLVLYPIVTGVSIFKSVEMIYQCQGVYASAMDHWVFPLVMATSLISHSRMHGNTNSSHASENISIAFEYSEEVCRPGSIQGLTAMCLITLYSLCDPHRFNSWYLIGMVSRVLVDLGLHQDPQPMTYWADRP